LVAGSEGGAHGRDHSRCVRDVATLSARAHARHRGLRAGHLCPGTGAFGATAPTGVGEATEATTLFARSQSSAAGATETQSLPELIDTWLPSGLIAHVQVNDPNRRAPGQGAMKFAPIFAALRRNGYDRTVAVEPFDYVPDGAGAAAFAAGYLRGVRECLA